MTADDKLAAFFATQEPPAYDARFVAEALSAFQRRERVHNLSLVALVGVVTVLIAVLVGGRLALPLNEIVPALMPVAVVMAALYATGRLPGVRA